ncbi:MAG: ATP-binding protein [Candidatus Aenigmatarchaeota archaeon]
MIIGRCIGEAKVNEVSFISSKVPQIGQYVILEYEGYKVLGMIENLVRFHPALEEVYNEESIEKIREIDKDSFVIKGKIKIIGEVESLKLPRIPPLPGTEVKVADKELLEKIFGKSEKSIHIGTLLTNSEVNVYLDINKLISRHLAILSITGAGKSNTVAVIVNELLKFNGTSLIFDMHSEYLDASFERKIILPTKINPLFLDDIEFAKLINIGEEAYVQARYLRKALREAKQAVFQGMLDYNKEKFFEFIIKKLEKDAEEVKDYSNRNSIFKVIAKIEDFLLRFGEVIDLTEKDTVDLLKKGYVNVLDLGNVDEETADVIVSHTLRKILEKRKSYKISKQGLSFPIFVVIEEAHILIPKDRETLSSYYVSRIAREGRKFGIGLCLVSQRPKNLDANALSQANNMIILKLVEPGDQRYVQEASEQLSEELLMHLPSLNIGEAVVIGPAIRIPALVKIKKFEGKISGTDIDFVEEWNKNEEIDL